MLHTPLMSGMNALSGITLLGALAAVGLTFLTSSKGTFLGQLLGGVAIIAATINVVGGFGVTHRMLKMFDKKKNDQTMTSTLYIIACAILSVAVLVGISFMSKVKTAVAGNLISAVSLFLGVVITLLYNNILSAWSIFPFMLIGILIGGALAARVKMIQMPQLVALLNGLGGLASALVGILSFLGIGILHSNYPHFVNVTSVLAIIVGLVTLMGSLVC